jgi:pyruvate/2-oxoglutarate dehydrogenase complex dihydrolipoamide acyltransferase (E2) component
VQRLLVILFLMGAAMYLLAPQRAAPVCEEKNAVAQARVESKQRADVPLRSSWRSTLKSLRQEPDTSPASQENGSYRQAAVYEEMPNQAQTNSEHINVTGDLAGSLGEASMAGTSASHKEPTQWARITRPATLHREASVSSPIVGYSGPGKEVQIREYVNGWFRVQDPETQENGWVFHKYVAYIYGPTPAEAQAATAEPPVTVASPTSQKPTRVAKPAVRKAAKRHDQDRRIAEDSQRRRWFGFFRRREAPRAWSFGPAY